MSLAIYCNLTNVTGAQARASKAAIRARLNALGARVTSIYRNPHGPEATRYRFIRVHFTTKDDQ